jgi:hypothetical protein
MGRGRTRTTDDVLESAFAHTEIPRGPITDEAAEVIASLLWDAAEREIQTQQAATDVKNGPATEDGAR